MFKTRSSYLDLSVGGESEGALAGHARLGLAHVLLVEQELPVQVGHVDRVQVDDLDVLEPWHKKKLDK